MKNSHQNSWGILILIYMRKTVTVCNQSCSAWWIAVYSHAAPAVIPISVIYNFLYYLISLLFISTLNFTVVSGHVATWLEILCNFPPRVAHEGLISASSQVKCSLAFPWVNGLCHISPFKFVFRRLPSRENFPFFMSNQQRSCPKTWRSFIWCAVHQYTHRSEVFCYIFVWIWVSTPRQHNLFTNRQSFMCLTLLYLSV